MTFFKIKIPFCLFFLFIKILFCLIFLYPAAAMGGKNSCSKFSAKFPFRLQDQQPCGYPGFDLDCNKKGKVTLKLPHSGDFFVRSIDDDKQEIRLHDPSGCVAKRLPKLNLSGSPFKAIAYMNFSFLSCSTKSISLSSSLVVVPCLSSSTNTVIATPSVNDFAYLHTCKELFGGPISVPRSFQSNKDIFSQFSQLEDNIPLRWSTPDDDSDQLTCRGEGKANKSLRVSFSVAIGAFAIFTLVSFFKRRRMLSPRMTAIEQPLILISPEVTLVQALILEQAAVTLVLALILEHAVVTLVQALILELVEVTPQLVNIDQGLDETTIESYDTFVLGESCRLPGDRINDDACCSICLAEYSPKETVKCIPECKHYFHADCIDQWLRCANTCPICRITPTPLPAAHASL